MIKQVLTPERKERVLQSVQFMAIMTEMIRLEYASDMDVRFKNPQINQFAGRIIKDCEAIKFHLKTDEKIKIKFKDEEFAEEYAGELYRVFHYFIGLPIDQIRQVMDNLHVLSEMVEDQA